MQNIVSEGKQSLSLTSDSGTKLTARQS